MQTTPPRVRTSFLAGLAVALAACASAGTMTSFPPDSAARPATDVPARFEPLDAAARLVDGDTIAGGGCRSPMVDPRDGTRLTFVRVVGERGDYEVPDGRYGTGSAGLLRLECNSGRVIGVVPR